METIELLGCLGCQRIIDNIIFRNQWFCSSCNGKYFKPVAPSKWTLIKWFIGNPKHVMKLLLLDIREKYSEYKKTS